jgi:signal transduction histidine kinase
MKDLLFIGAFVTIVCFALKIQSDFFFINPDLKHEIIFTSINDDETTIKLPVGTIVAKEDGYESLILESNLDLPAGMEKPVLYIPNYVGVLSIWFNGDRITTEPAHNGTLGDSRHSRSFYLVDIDRKYLGEDINIRLQLTQTNDRLGSSLFRLSKVYSGESKFFDLSINRRSLYKRSFEESRFSVLSLGFAFFLITTIFGGLGFQGVSITVLIGILSLIQIGSLDAGVLIGDLSRKTFMLAPIMIWALDCYISQQKTQNYRNLKIFHLTVSLSIVSTVFLAIWLELFSVSDTIINGIYSIPYLLCGLFILVTNGLISIFKDETNRTSPLVLAVLITWLVSIFYDGSAHFSGNVGLNWTSVTMLLVLIFLAADFSAKILMMKSELKDYSEYLEIKLQEESLKLKKEFENSAHLMNENRKISFYSQIQNDLHDGVLTYLFSIKTISDRYHSADYKTISELSQFCLNEIRVIISSKIGGKTKLILALANLRHNFVDALPDIGILVDWDTSQLLDLPETDFQMNLEVVRILQEAMYNAVNRSNCKKLSVKCALESNYIHLSVRNEGGAALVPSKNAGRGLQSFNIRAEKLSASLTLRALKTGAQLDLRVPLSSLKVETTLI